MATLPLAARTVLKYSLRAPYHRGKWRVVDGLIWALRINLADTYMVERDGLQWLLSPDDHPQRDLFWYGLKDRWEMHHVGRIIRPGATAFDVGANFGYYSLKLDGMGARCYAFEPNPTMFCTLQENIRLNGTGVSAFRCGLSDTVGSAKLHPVGGNSGASFLESGDGVQLTTLDAFCVEHGIASVDFIKVDVEGFEERFLRGAQGIIEQHHPAILIELNPETLPRTGSSVMSVVRLLRSFRYELMEIRRDKLVPLDENFPKDYVNVLCL
jgi:FkbM family methyltransferase